MYCLTFTLRLSPRGPRQRAPGYLRGDNRFGAPSLGHPEAQMYLLTVFDSLGNEMSPAYADSVAAKIWAKRMRHVSLSQRPTPPQICRIVTHGPMARNVHAHYNFCGNA